MAWFVVKMTNLLVKWIQWFPHIAKEKKRQYLCLSLNHQTEDYLFRVLRVVVSLHQESWANHTFVRHSFPPPMPVDLELLFDINQSSFRTAQICFSEQQVWRSYSANQDCLWTQGFAFPWNKPTTEHKTIDLSPCCVAWKFILQAANVLLQSTVRLDPTG